MVWLFRFSLTALLLWVTSPLFAQARLHAVIVSDTISDDISVDMKANIGWIERALITNCPKSQLNLVIIKDRNYSKRNILNTLATMSVDPSDGLMFILSGHGKYAPGRGTFFEPKMDNNQRLYFSEITEAMQAKGAQTTVAIVDCCSIIPEGRLGYAAPAAEEVTRFSDLFQSLFFSRSGLICMNSSAPGEYALCRSVAGETQSAYLHGSVFTSCLSGQLIENKDKQMNWKDFSKLMRQKVDKDFERFSRNGTVRLAGGRTIDQDYQTVWSVQNGKYLLSFER
jgi:hypothetical protein